MSRCNRSISTLAPMNVVPTDSVVCFAIRSANTSHSPAPTAPNSSRGTTAFQRNTRTSGLRPEEAIQVVQLGRYDRAVQRGAFHALGDRRAVADDAPPAREEQRQPQHR